MNISPLLHNLQTCLQSHWFLWSLTLISVFFCCNSSTGFEQEVLVNQRNREMSKQCVHTSWSQIRFPVELDGVKSDSLALTISCPVVSSSSSQKFRPKKLIFHLHIMPVFRLHEAVSPVLRAWCLGTRPAIFLGCDVMHYGRDTNLSVAYGDNRALRKVGTILPDHMAAHPSQM
jgi:hypothetical protein